MVELDIQLETGKLPKRCIAYTLSQLKFEKILVDIFVEFLKIFQDL